MANLSAIKLPNGTTYNLKDNGALQLTGGSVTGPVSFGDSVSIDEATIGDLVVNGSASFTNNLQANTINGVVVGDNPKFTDTNTVTTVTTTGSGNAVTAITASNGALTVTKSTTFLTSHQDISGKADKSATVSTVAYDSTNKKITKTINGTTSDVVTVATLKTALGYTASDVGALPSSTTYVSTITTTAGAHSTISNKSGAVTFNIPTKTSHLTNDSNFITLNNIESTSIPTADIIAEFDSAAHMSSTDMTTSEVSDFVNSLNVGGGDEIINLFYPVGSYYETEDGTFNPNVAWGGTWVLESTAKQPTGEFAGISNRNTVNVTTTSRRDLLSLSFTSKTGRVFVHADVPFFTSRYTSTIHVLSDNVEIGYATTNATTMQRGIIETITDVGVGAHTFSLQLRSQDTGTTATLAPYNHYTFYVTDVANPNGGVYKWHRTA